MSYSWNTFDEVVRVILREIQPENVLDIGAGQGKYGRMVKQIGLTDSRTIAVELDPELKETLLDAGYDEVWPVDVRQFMEDYAGKVHDVVVMGDVIEHMKHSDGRDLLEFLNYRSRFIIIVTPECMPMTDRRFYVGHNSLWRPDSLMWHDKWAHQQCGVMHFYLLRGLLDMQGPKLDKIVNQVNTGGLLLSHHSNNTTIPVSLKIHDTVYREHTSDGGAIQYRPE